MTRSKPHRIMVAVDDLKLADVCRQHGYGIEIQSFLEPEKVPDLQRALGDLQPRSLHGPFGDLCAGSYDPMIREVTRHRFELAYRFARELECPDIILHHGLVRCAVLFWSMRRRLYGAWKHLTRESRRQSNGYEPTGLGRSRAHIR